LQSSDFDPNEERAVFRLGEAGIELIEVAPGIDTRKHLLEKMAFEPVVRGPGSMPAHVFDGGS